MWYAIVMGQKATWLRRMSLRDAGSAYYPRRGGTMKKKTSKPSMKVAAGRTKAAAKAPPKKKAATPIATKSLKHPATTGQNDGLKKQYLKSRNACKVTFMLPREAASDARNVALCGDFNNWDSNMNLMKPLKKGDYTVTLELEKDKEYRFRYLINGSRWENDWKADRYVPNAFGGDDSVVVV
jgi:hypothetical protein